MVQENRTHSGRWALQRAYFILNSTISVHKVFLFLDMKKLLITLFLSTSLSAFSQSTCDSLIQLKGKVYGFSPSSLSDSLQNLKSKELDEFWRVARNNKEDAAPCLKDLIENETHDSFFCFDASSLLMRVDTSVQYLPTVAKGLDKCDLKDLQLGPYLQNCFYLAYRKQDIGDLTIKLISYPNAKIFLSNHFITLNAIDASLFLFNTMEPTSAEELLIQAITNGNPTCRHNAAVVLNLMATDTGDDFLNSLINKKQLGDSTIKFIEKDRKTFIITPKGASSRSKVLEALKDVPYNFEKRFFGFAGNDKLIGSACKQLGKADQELIREARQRSTPGLSDEALYEYFALTKILMTVRSKGK